MEFDDIVAGFFPHSVAFEDMYKRCEDVTAAGHDIFHSNVIDVSTMTLSCSLDCSIDMTVLKKAKEDGTIERMGINAHTDTRFPNQLTFRVPRLDDSPRPVRRRKKHKAGCNVKVCANGSLNLTGCKTLQEGCLVVALLTQALSATKATPLRPKLQKVRLGMVNTILNLGRAVRLDGLSTALLKANANCHYDTERHAGVQVSSPEGYSFVFRSGSITCGSSKFELVPGVWKVLIDVLSDGMDRLTYDCDTATKLSEDVLEAIRKNVLSENIECFRPPGTQ